MVGAWALLLAAAVPLPAPIQSRLSQGGFEVPARTPTGSDTDAEVDSRLALVIGMVLTLSFVLLLLFFRSPLLALKATLMNLLWVLAAYGILTFVFVQGHGVGLLGICDLGAAR